MGRRTGLLSEEEEFRPSSYDDFKKFFFAFSLIHKIIPLILIIMKTDTPYIRMMIALFSTDAEHLKIGFLEVDGTECSELNQFFAHARLVLRH